MATLRAQASVEDENNTGTVMKKLIAEHKPVIRDEILFQVPDQTEHSFGLPKHGLGPCFSDEFPEYLGKYYPHDVPLPLARSTKDWAPDWENYGKSRPFKMWVTSTSEYNDWLVRIEKVKRDVWKKAGIHNAILMSYDMPPPDTALISALAFFWSTSTNAFHFPCGPMTPTLQDVAFITSLRPHGIEANDALDPPKISFEYPKKKDITFNYFLEQNVVTNPAVEVSEMEHIAFLIFWLNKFIFCSSHLKITRYYTDLAKALSVGQEIALAPIFLAHFYRCMKELVDHKVSGCTGPLWLLQFWAWSYFSDLAPEETPEQKQRKRSGDKVFCGLYLKSLVPKEHSFDDCFKYFYFLAEDPRPEFWMPFERNSTCSDWLQTPTTALSSEDPVHRAVWDSFLVARDLPYGMGSGGPNNKCGVEYYNPTQCARQFGLAQFCIPPYQTINSALNERMLLTLDDTKKLMEKNAALISSKFKLAPFPEFPLTTPAFDIWWRQANFSQSSESLELILKRISPMAVAEGLPLTKEAKVELLIKKTKATEKAKSKSSSKKKGTPSHAEIYQSIRRFETFFKCKWNPRNPEAMEEARRNRMTEIEARQKDLAAAAWWKIFQSTPPGEPMPSLEDLTKPFGKSIPPTPDTSFAIADTLAYEGMYELFPENRRVTVVKTDAPRWEIEDFYKRGIVRVINSAQRDTAPLVELSDHDEEDEDDEDTEEEARKEEKAPPQKPKRRLVKAVDSKRSKRKKIQQQEQSGETGDKTISDSAPKTLVEKKSTDAASSDIGISSKEIVPASIQVEVTIADPAGNVSQSSAIPAFSKDSSLASPTRSTAVSSKVKIDTREILNRLKEKLKRALSFAELKAILVQDCGTLGSLFQLPIVGCLTQLKKPTIISCHMMEEVFIWEEQLGDVHIATNNRIEFPKLQVLTLDKLPSLLGFCRGIDQIDFPQLERLKLQELGQLNRLFHINNNQSSISEQNDDVGFHYLFPQKVSLPNLKVLKLAELENLERLGDDPLLAGSLSQLKKISMRDCGRLLCVIPSQLLMMLRDLEKLKVKCCNLLEVVFKFEGVEYNEPNPEILPPLELVKLSDLPKLNYISKRDPTGFKYIRDLDIDNCNRLRYVFSPTMTKSIPQLRELKIWRCEMLSRIIAEENELGESTVDEVEFPQLRTVELRDLPNLVSFFPNVNTTSMAKSTNRYHNLLQPQPLFNEKVAIPNLERLELRGLENVSDLWSNELLIGSFSKLKNLKVSDCSILEAVVGKEEQVQGHGREIAKTIFPELGKLKLRSLPSLRRFCHFTHPLEIPMLRKVDILDCPNMDAFSLEPVSTPNLGTGDLNYGIPLLKEISRQKENQVKEVLNWFMEFANSIEEKVKKDVDVDEDQEETENRRKEQEHQRKEDGDGNGNGDANEEEKENVDEDEEEEDQEEKREEEEEETMEKSRKRKWTDLDEEGED